MFSNRRNLQVKNTFVCNEGGMVVTSEYSPSLTSMAIEHRSLHLWLHGHVLLCSFMDGIIIHRGPLGWCSSETHLCRCEKVLGSISGPVKSDTVSPPLRHFFGIVLSRRQSAEMGLVTRFAVILSIMKILWLSYLISKNIFGWRYVSFSVRVNSFIFPVHTRDCKRLVHGNSLKSFVYS